MIKNIVIVVLLFVSVYLFVNSKKDIEYKTITNTILVNDSSYTELIDTLELIDLPAIIDTLKVIEEYYSKFNYKRNYSDKYINIVLNDTIHQNQIFSGNLSYTIKDFPVVKPYKYGVGLDYIPNIGLGYNITYSKNRFDYSVVYYPNIKNIGAGVVFRF